MSDDNEEYIRGHLGFSFSVKLGQLIVSVQDSSPVFRTISFVVGRTGFPNVVCRDAKIGAAVLFETPDDGIVEVRFYHFQDPMNPVFRIARVTPAGGITGGLVDADPQNTPFTQAEIARIQECLETVKETVRQRNDLLRPEQMAFLGRKLDDLAAAAHRMGRKDWINLAVGILTNTIVGAALSSDAAKFLFRAAGAALSWLWGNALQLFP
jgi:hypothetical protein